MLLVLAFLGFALSVILIVLDNPVIVFVLTVALIVIVATAGTPVAFIAGFVIGMFYALSESFWHRCSYTNRILAGIGVGLLMTLAIPIIGITIFQPFQWDSWVNPGIGGQLIAVGFIVGLALGGIAAGIDWLFLAGREANSYRKNYAHSH